MKIITVKNDDTLLNYVLNSQTGYNRNKLKSLLKNECMSINHKVTTQFNDPVEVGDVIRIKAFNEQFGLAFDIIYEDDYIIVIDKPAGILSVPFNEDDKETTYDLVYDYVTLRNKRAELHIVHRLDQGTSGVLMFAKDEKTKDLYQDSWNKLTQERIYIAYVEGVVSKDQDTIISNLKVNENTTVYSSKTGKKAITHYEVLKRLADNTILKIKIDTGRQNQIRVHLNDVTHPIVGDKKYGAKTNPLKRLGLHAYQLVIKNPRLNQVQTFTAQAPKVFNIKL